MKRVISLLVLGATLLFGTGCWDRREIEERSTILVFSLDSAKGIAVPDDTLAVSAQVAIPGGIPLGGSSAGGGTEKSPVSIYSSTGRSSREALSNLQKRLNQKLFFGHTRVIGVSDELAKDGLEPHMDILRRNPEIRRLLWLVVVKGDAANLVKFRPQLEQVPAFYLTTLFENDVRTGRMSNVYLGEYFIRRSNGGQDPVLPYIEVTESDIKRLGVAVFQDDRMVGSLSTEEDWAFLQARGTPTASEEQRIEMPTGSVVLQVITRRRKITHEWQDGELSIHMRITLEANVVETLGDIHIGNDPNVLTQIGDRLAESVKRNIDAVIKKTQDWNTDIVGFGEYIRAFSPREWQSINWREVYPTVTIEVEPQVFIRRVGMTSGR